MGESVSHLFQHTSVSEDTASTDSSDYYTTASDRDTASSSDDFELCTNSADSGGIGHTTTDENIAGDSNPGTSEGNLALTAKYSVQVHSEIDTVNPTPLCQTPSFSSQPQEVQHCSKASSLLVFQEQPSGLYQIPPSIPSSQAQEAQHFSHRPSSSIMLSQTQSSSQAPNEHHFHALDGSPESRALSQHSVELFMAISASELMPLVWQLFAKKIIALDTAEYCQLPTVISSDKSSKIVTAVIETVNACPSIFDSLVLVLSESGNTALKLVGEKLQQTCCFEQLPSKNPSHSKSSHAHLPITPQQIQSSPISRYANYLRALYTRSKIPEYSSLACYKWIPSPGKKFKFINLAIIRKEKISEEEADKIKSESIHGHIDTILKETSPGAPVLLENIFQVEQGHSPTCVLIEGAPGIGKSMLAWELCQCWGRGKFFQEYSLVLLVMLRDERMQQVTHVEDLFYHNDRKLQEEVVQEINSINGKGILIVLEGLDELPRRLFTECSVFTDLISGRIFPEATVLVTSRPSATVELYWRGWKEKSRLIEILGFTEENIDEYLRSVLTNHQLLGFNHYLSIHPHIKSMMYVPLHCAITIAVFLQCQQSSRPPPKTLTGLYTCLTRIILIQYLQDHSDYRGKDYQLNSFCELPATVYTHFKRLCRIAFDGIDKQQLVFHNLPQSPDKLQQFEHLGFMNVVPEICLQSTNYSYNFLHLSVQEYLAAYYVSLMSHHEQEQLLQKARYDHRYNMIRFLAGITQLKHLDEKLVQKIIGIEKRNVLDFRKLKISKHTLQFLYECQDVSILNSECSYCIEIKHTNSDYCLMALGFCIAKSSSWWYVKFSGRDTSGTEVLFHSLNESFFPTYAIGGIRCSDCTIGFTHQVLKNLPWSIIGEIRELSIEQDNIQPLPPSVHELIPTMKNLYSLTLINVLDTSLTSLIPVLFGILTLQNLILHKVKSEGTALLCQWLPTCHLETLTFYEQIEAKITRRMDIHICNNSLQSIKCLNSTITVIDQILSLKSVMQVTHLTICNDNPQPLPRLMNRISRMERLETLTLTNILDTSLIELIPALSNIPRLRNLTLSELNSEGIVLLCQWLPTCQLTELTVCGEIPNRTVITFQKQFVSFIEEPAIECQYHKTEFTDQILSQLPQQFVEYVKTLTMAGKYNMCEHSDKDSQGIVVPIPLCLPEIITKMKMLNTLILENVLNTSMTELIPSLSRVPSLRNLTLHKLDSRGIILLCQWLPTCHLEKLTLLEKISDDSVPMYKYYKNLLSMTFYNNCLEAIECQYCAKEYTDQILQQIPLQSTMHVKTLTVDTDIGQSPQCLPEIIPRMVGMSTLILKNIHGSALTELIPALSRIPTLRDLRLVVHQMSSEGIVLLSQWLPKCPLKILNLHDRNHPGQELTMSFCSNSIETIKFQDCTTEFIDLILSQQSLVHVKTLQVYNEIRHRYIDRGEEDAEDGHCILLPVQPCLLELIPKMERLNTLTLEGILDTSLTEVIPVLSRVPTLKNLTLSKLNSEGIVLLCKWLPACQLETLIICYSKDFLNQYYNEVITISDQTVTATFYESSFETNKCQDHATEFIDQTFSQTSEPTAQVTLAPCLSHFRVEKLSTLTRKNILHTSLSQLVPALSRITSLKSLTLPNLNSKCIAPFCQWLPTYKLKELIICCSEETHYLCDELSTMSTRKRIVTATFSNISVEAIKCPYSTMESIDNILLEIPQPSIAHVKTLKISGNEYEYEEEEDEFIPMPLCLLDMVPKMERLNTLTLKYILDTSLTKLIPALSVVTTLRNLMLHRLNSKGISLLCQWLPKCQLETLTFIDYKDEYILYEMKITLCNNLIDTIECQYYTVGFINQILQQIPLQSLIHATVLIIIGYHQPLPPCLQELIPKIQILKTLRVKIIPDISLTKLMPLLSTVFTLKNLTLYKLSSEFSIALLCQWLSTCQLETLTLPALSPDHIETVSRALTTVPSLKELDIQKSGFTFQSMQAFASMLKQNNSLIDLDISQCNIDNVSVCYLAEVLLHDTTLRKLNLSGNVVGETGILAVAEIFKHNTSLEELYLSNAKISSDGAVAVSEALHHNTTLRKLNMNMNPIEDRGALAMSEMLKHNTTLEELDISYAKINSDGAVAMSEALYHNQTLKKINMSWSPLGERGKSALAEMLEQNTTLEEWNFTEQYTVKENWKCWQGY